MKSTCKTDAHASIAQNERTTTFTYDGGDEGLSVAVLEAVASAADTDPIALEPRLYDVIDPESLEGCFETADDELVITFTFGEYKVTVVGNGRIFVSERK